MAWLLNIAYLLALVVCAPWLGWQALRTGKYRDGWGAKLLGRVPARTGGRPCIWLHAVSVGEVNLLGTLIAELQRRVPGAEICISTTTRTGLEQARRRYTGHAVFYCPLDFTWAVRRALVRIRPDLLVLAELELWPNLIALAQRAGARVAVVNGRLSDNSLRGYRRLRPLLARVLAQLDLVAVQTPLYAERFLALGARPAAVHVTGSLKFDGAPTDRDHPVTRRLAQLARIAAEDVVFLAGSTQDEEERMALATFAALAPRYPALRLILVPRHPERFDDVAALLDASGLAWQRRSQLDHSAANPQARILLVDRMGELGAWWGTAHVGLVGGSFGEREGQNMIEPAALGVAVSFGPRTRNFRQVVELLLAADAAVVVRTQPELTALVERALAEPAWRAALGRRARDVVLSQLGAAARTGELLAALLPAANDARCAA